jgi:pimeloyl-ACP methyl ester carboxylesterase
MRVVSLFLVALVLAACAAQPTAPAAGPTLALEPCQLSAAGMDDAVEARCGTLAVYEDQAAQSGPTIDLRIVQVSAIGRAPQADPLVLLAGGPGQAASEAFAPLIDALGLLNQERDLLLVDQRGTGGSNRLSCPLADDSPDSELDEAATQAWVTGCLTTLAGSPTLYTTASAAADLDQVRAALGYEQLNLLGVSYGTRMALTYAKLYPARVRTLVLDGVVPQDAALGADFAAYGQRALDLIFARCASDPACAEAFPNLGETFSALLERLEREPALVQLSDPQTGTPTELRLSRDMVAVTVQTLSYAPETAALLPLLIHRAGVEGDLAPLAAQLLIVSGQLGESIASGMRLAVMCAEDVPFYPADTAAQAEASYMGDYVVRQLGQSCASWPRATIAADTKEPVVSALPTLLLSGEADPVTPPQSAEQAARTLSNHLHIVVPGQGHNVFYRGCLPSLIADFIGQASAAGLDTTCVAQIRPTAFFTSFTGPTP